METISDLIKQIRAAGFSQMEMSRRLDIPQPRLSRWEGGSVPAGADDALKLKRWADEIAAVPPTTHQQEVSHG